MSLARLVPWAHGGQLQRQESKADTGNFKVAGGRAAIGTRLPSASYQVKA